MVEILLEHGYINNEHNEWVKDEWVVRFDDEYIEVFNNPTKGIGKYCKEKLSEENLKDILVQINKM